VNLFYCNFGGNIVLYAVSCLMWCLPELSNDNNQPTKHSKLCVATSCFLRNNVKKSKAAWSN